MGFFGGLGRLVQGKPVFEAPEQSTGNGNQPLQTEPPVTAETKPAGPKIIPEAVIERCEYHNNGSHMRLSCHIQNNSTSLLELDKFRLLGTVRDLNFSLRPGESRELVVYDGQRPRNRNYDDAYLAYKNEVGDYFEAYHTVEFKQENDQTYSVVRFRLVHPIKDI